MKIKITANEDETVGCLLADIQDAIGAARGEFTELKTCTFTDEGELNVTTESGRSFTLQVWENL